MQTNQQGFPRVTAPVVDVNTGIIEQIWYQFFVSLWQRTGGGKGGAPNPIVNIDVTASPFSYIAPIAGNVWIDPGTYCKVTMERGGDVLSFGYVTRGIFPLSVGDVLTVTYTTYPPVMHFI